MVSKSQIKLVRSLGQQKFRQKYDKFTAEGEKTVIEFLNRAIFPVEAVYSSSLPLLEKLRSKKPYYVVEQVTPLEMEQMSSFKTPSPVLAVFSKKENICDIGQLHQKRSIYLDDIQDPGNMGTIIRLADWFGIQNIIRSSGSADFFHPKVIQSTMGSLCNVKTATSQLQILTDSNPGIHVMGAFMDGIPLHKIQSLPPTGILIIGNEGHGISAENVNFITQKISISGSSQRIAESLNAAIACSIICHHWTFLGKE